MITESAVRDIRGDYGWLFSAVPDPARPQADKVRGSTKGEFR
jgi:hypothetical protein